MSFSISNEGLEMKTPMRLWWLWFRQWPIWLVAPELNAISQCKGEIYPCRWSLVKGGQGEGGEMTEVMFTIIYIAAVFFIAHHISIWFWGNRR